MIYGTRTTFLVLAVVAVGGAGCGEGVLFETDKTEYLVGEPIVLVLRNYTSRVVGYNLCNSQVECLENCEAPTPVDSSPVCPAILRNLLPLQEARYTFDDTAAWGLGTFRLFTTVEVRGHQERIAAEALTVSRPE